MLVQSKFSHHEFVSLENPRDREFDAFLNNGLKSMFWVEIMALNAQFQFDINLFLYKLLFMNDFCLILTVF